MFSRFLRLSRSHIKRRKITTVATNSKDRNIFLIALGGLGTSVLFFNQFFGSKNTAEERQPQQQTAGPGTVPTPTLGSGIADRYFQDKTPTQQLRDPMDFFLEETGSAGKTWKGFNDLKDDKRPDVPISRGIWLEPPPPVEAPYSAFEKKYLQLLDRYVLTGEVTYSDWDQEIDRPEIQKQIKKVEELTAKGQKSVHPWFPSDRKHLDEYWRGFIPERLGWELEDHPVVVPERTPHPYGKLMTVVFDIRSLTNSKDHVRPGTYIMLGQIMRKYEIIFITSSNFQGNGIDPAGQVTSYMVRPYTNIWVDPRSWRSLRTLNRPFESTILVDSKPEQVTPNPNNAVILRAWNGDSNDSEVLNVGDFLDYAAVKHLTNGVPVYEICPQFQDINMDISEIWKKVKKSGGAVGQQLQKMIN